MEDGYHGLSDGCSDKSLSVERQAFQSSVELAAWLPSSLLWAAQAF